MNAGIITNAMPSSLVLIMFYEAKIDAAIQFHPHEVQQGNRVFFFQLGEVSCRF
jgi:hypothetical protein